MSYEIVGKYIIKLSEARDLHMINMPKGAKVISVINQREDLAIYAIIKDDDYIPTVDYIIRQFRIAGTGHPLNLPVSAKFVGTVSFRDGALILHVWDCGE